MRPVSRENEDGTRSSHLMSWEGDPSKKRGEFGVYPTITPVPGKEKSSDAKNWTTQSADEAIEKGEYITVNSRRKAQRLAAGSWKRGKDRREAMRSYREEKKNE